jgi:hypothetical protein
MNDTLNINIVALIKEILPIVWTGICIPLLNYSYQWLKAKRVDKYGMILYDEVKKAVKCVYETEVKDIKSTDDWTLEKQAEVKELAKTKAIQALSTVTYRCLKEANGDFEDYLDSLIGTALFDIKNEK